MKDVEYVPEKALLFALVVIAAIAIMVQLK